MGEMDHATALKIGAAERYCAGELSAEERDAFEEHFFDCGDCAAEVRDAAAFAANLRAVLREGVTRGAVPVRRFAWWRPAFAASLACNVLAAGLVLWRVAGPSVPGPAVAALVPVNDARRGPEAAVTAHTSTPLLPLSFIVPRTFDRYSYEIAPEAGGRTLTGDAPAPPNLRDEIILAIPAGLLAQGAYRVTLFGAGAGEGERVRLGGCRLQILP